MAQGQKRSRFVAWSYLDAGRRAAWLASRTRAPKADVERS
jgi:23S rRNA (adenine1618-N6)-methyltransferase